MERYERIERIGEGAYGVVFKARNVVTNELVAMKRIRLDAVEGEGIPATTLREIGALRELACENVVRLDDVVRSDNRLYLVFEYMEQDLKMYLDSIGPEGMSPRLVRSFAYQMLNGLAYCHAHRVMHRDLKPQNILIDTAGNLKLGDFGLARAFNVPIRKYTHEVVTLWYRAPEILLGADYYSTPVDIWAAACIIAEMSNLSALFMGDSEIDQLFRIFRVLGTPHDGTWPGVSRFRDFALTFPQWPPFPSLSRFLPHLGADGVALVEALLRYEPTQRLTAREALDHEFFRVDEGMLSPRFGGFGGGGAPGLSPAASSPSLTSPLPMLMPPLPPQPQPQPPAHVHVPVPMQQQAQAQVHGTM